MDLSATQDQQRKRFEILLTEIFEQHASLIEKMKRDYALERDELEQTKKYLSEEIE